MNTLGPAYNELGYNEQGFVSVYNYCVRLENYDRFARSQGKQIIFPDRKFAKECYTKNLPLIQGKSFKKDVPEL